MSLCVWLVRFFLNLIILNQDVKLRLIRIRYHFDLCMIQLCRLVLDILPIAPSCKDKLIESQTDLLDIIMRNPYHTLHISNHVPNLFVGLLPQLGNRGCNFLDVVATIMECNHSEEAACHIYLLYHTIIPISLVKHLRRYNLSFLSIATVINNLVPSTLRRSFINLHKES